MKFSSLVVYGSVASSVVAAFLAGRYVGASGEMRVRFQLIPKRYLEAGWS